MLKRLDAAIFDDRSAHLDRFGLLLLVTVAAIVALFLIDLNSTVGDLGNELATAAVSVFVGAMLILAMRASGVARRWTRLAGILVSLGLAGAAILLLIGLLPDRYQVDYGPVSPPWLLFALAGFAPLLVVRRLVKHRRVSSSTVVGAIAAFLLIAVTFDFVFLGVDAYQSTPFFGHPEPTTSFMYFSIMTVTTTGYGDLVPATELARLLASSAAVTGQVFLVTFVAMVVGLFSLSWRAGGTDE